MQTDRRQLILGSIIASAVLLVSPFLAANPAQAYGSLTVRYAVVDTGNCDRLSGTLPVAALSDSCFLNDTADDTWFLKDPGGRAVKIELHDGSGMVAKTEFHPYGEHLWVYDTRNDGDTVYTMLFLNTFPYDVYSPPGTSAVIDFRDFNLSFDEGDQIDLRIADDAAISDHITPFDIGGRA